MTTDAKNGEGQLPSPTSGGQLTTESSCVESDAQSNASKGIRTAQEAVPSKATSHASSTRNSTPAAASVNAHQAVQNPTDASFAMEDVQQLQETSHGTSDVAQPSSKDSEQNGEMPSSYGTRSRNRPGRVRPNYAEDTDMDFEMGVAAANGNLSDPPSRNSVAPDNLHSSGSSGKKGPSSVQGDASWGNSGSNAKEHATNANLPSAAAASPASLPASTVPPLTKRRKNAATSTTNGAHAGAAAPSQTGAKRGSHHAMVVATHAARETNMMTFEKTGAFLKEGHLQADDGQTVKINGKF